MAPESGNNPVKRPASAPSSKIDTAQANQMAELEATQSQHTPALAEYRARIRARFVTAEEDRATLTAELDALTAAAPPIHDPTVSPSAPSSPPTPPKPSPTSSPP
jgi:hypothetical protein